MSAKINWKKRAQEAEADLRKALSYAYDYGNATGRCEGGYLQQRGLICHHCNADKSAGQKCKFAPKVLR
jgi:hypothetical protein